MGGYGTMRLGMKSPDVFSSIYALSPCCMDVVRSNPIMISLLKRLETVKTDEGVKNQSFFGMAMLASAAAWSPNPKNPPFIGAVSPAKSQISNLLTALDFVGTLKKDLYCGFAARCAERLRLSENAPPLLSGATHRKRRA